jgi:hypothetical protein
MSRHEDFESSGRVGFISDLDGEDSGESSSIP